MHASPARSVLSYRLATTFVLALGACGGGGSSASGPTLIGDSGAVVDLPKYARLTTPTPPDTEWSVSATFVGFTFVNLEPHVEMPDDYAQESMVRESNLAGIDQHGVLTRGSDGLIIFSHESSNGSSNAADRSRVVESWLPEAEAGKATYCYANSHTDDQTAYAICRSLRKKGSKAAVVAALPAATTTELPVTNMMMDPRLVEPCVQECKSSGEAPGDLAAFDSSPYGICFNSCKQRIANEINARVVGR